MINRLALHRTSLVIVAFTAILLSDAAVARNLDNRTGFGMTAHSFNNVGALSLRHHFSQYISVTAVFGFDTDSTKNVTVLGAKLLRNSYMEENLNFYVGMAGYVIADRVGGANTATGMEFSGLLGVEFFLGGLPNLGFQLESGIAIRTNRNINSASFGGMLGGFGIHYYF